MSQERDDVLPEDDAALLAALSAVSSRTANWTCSTSPGGTGSAASSIVATAASSAAS